MMLPTTLNYRRHSPRGPWTAFKFSIGMSFAAIAIELAVCAAIVFASPQSLGGRFCRAAWESGRGILLTPWFCLMFPCLGAAFTIAGIIRNENHRIGLTLILLTIAWVLALCFPAVIVVMMALRGDDLSFPHPT